MKSVAAEERRIQQQIVAQQKKELTSFLENQKKEYRLCKDKIKEVNIKNKSAMSRIVPVAHETSSSHSSHPALLFLGDERRPLHTQGREAGAPFQAQRNNAALSGRGGGSSARPAEAGVRPELQGPQTPESGPTARVRAGANERGESSHDTSECVTRPCRCSNTKATL